MLVLRHRYVGDGMREDVVLRNVGAVDVRCRLELVVEPDFADLFEVKEGRVVARGTDRSWADPRGSTSSGRRPATCADAGSPERAGPPMRPAA